MAAILLLSPLSLAFSASVILDIKFFIAVVRYCNHPGVLVSATSKSMIVAISVKVLACLVHQSTYICESVLAPLLESGAFWCMPYILHPLDQFLCF